MRAGATWRASTCDPPIMIGGVIMTHGGDKGLILPPLLAPYQVAPRPSVRCCGATRPTCTCCSTTTSCTSTSPATGSPHSGGSGRRRRRPSPTSPPEIQGSLSAGARPADATGSLWTNRATAPGGFAAAHAPAGPALRRSAPGPGQSNAARPPAMRHLMPHHAAFARLLTASRGVPLLAALREAGTAVTS